ncbi:MAG: hypothetical protein ISR78_07185 [Spirochaetia bacterium]|nr:hypothetical protein [Spirochaetia bacterium]
MKIVDLAGSWRLLQREKDIDVPITIPGDIYSALLEAGIIDDPYYSTNELDQLWIGRCSWELTCTFSLTDSELSDYLYVHADSIDTIASLYINNELIGESSNMFVRKRILLGKVGKVGNAVRAGENTLRIVLEAPETAAIARAEEVSHYYPFSEYPVTSPHRNLIRKVQCHGGWDWGPCIMTSGLYGDMYIGNAAPFRIDYVTTRSVQIPGSRDWEVEISCEIYTPEKGLMKIAYELDDIQCSQTVEMDAGTEIITAKVVKTDPELWWPSGYGSRPLYSLKVTVPGDSIQKRIGFRKIETISEKDDSGLSMFFRVNGRDVFCKGANWIPVDALPSRHTEEAYRRLLEDAAAVHMNMIRVWGGGQYESDLFYDICDELGILVWQDFMFSCSTYPAEREFLSSVEAETVHQVKRLKDHPSIAIWCGNNECLGALTWYKETIKERDVYLVDYDRLYNGTIG